MYLIQKGLEMRSHTGYFWLWLAFPHSHLCRWWIIPVTQLETVLYSMTTLLVHRHGAHVPFHFAASSAYLEGGRIWWGKYLAGSPESSLLILHFKLTDMIGLLTDSLSRGLGILQDTKTLGFSEGQSLTWSNSRAAGIQGPRMSEQKRLDLQSCG